MSHTLFLVGARAAGKTTLGTLLAKRLDFSFIDTDDYLQKKINSSITQIVEKKGWRYFRIQESLALKEVTKPNRVIATGGGIVLAEHNRIWMQQHGIVFYLSVPIHHLVSRLTHAPNLAQRPSLTGQSIVDELEKVHQERQPLYHQVAHHVIDGSLAPDQILSQIINHIP
ncbi:MAG: shikimate kinase AroL [Candidatus Schmidhempelia sp.]|nr:shikimate kinase AroL [Candidatus Schmidhempelia sp.]